MSQLRKKPRGWLARINLISPKVCRMVARKHRGHRPMTNEDIARVSGLHKSTIKRLYNLDNWNGVTAETIHRFSFACGVDLLRPGRTVVKFLRDKSLLHIRRVKHAATRKLLYAKLPKGHKASGD